MALRDHLKVLGVWPLVAAALGAASCMPMPWGDIPIGAGPSQARASGAPPQDATPQTPEERMARGSAVVAGTVAQGAVIAQAVPVPGVQQAAEKVQLYTVGYLDEINRQIAGLGERMRDADPTNNPTRADWRWAIGAAAIAGWFNVLGVRRGQRLANGGNPR